MKRYEKYKDSGIEWLGEVPEHWEVKKLKFLCTTELSNVDKKTVDGEIPVLLCNYVDVYYNKEISNTLNFMEATAKPEQINKFSLLQNDILFTKDSESPIDIAVAAIVIQNLPGVLCGYHLALLRTFPQIVGKYLYYLIESSGIRDQFYANATGVTRFSLSKDTIKNVLLAVPTRKEQQKIAHFIDQKTADIDNLTQTKERLIESLKQYRKALITETVTKGLNPNAKMKDSGIEWIGEVPEHWDISSFRRYCKLQQGLQIAQELRVTEPGKDRYKYITIKYLNSKRDDQAEYIEKPSNRVICTEDDVLLARTGATGEVVTNCRGVYHNNFFKVIYDKKSVNRDYLVYYLSNYNIKQHFKLVAGTTTIPDLNHGDFLSTIFLIPNLAEQEKIVTYLDQKTTEIDTLIADVKTQIQTLKDYRQALIFEVVTGKLDVRGEEVQ